MIRRRGDAPARLGPRPEIGIEEILLRRGEPLQELGEDRHVAGPVHRHDRLDARGLDRRHAGPEPFERPDRALHGGRDVRLHLGQPQVGTVGDAKAGHAVLEPDSVVPAVGGQGGRIARVGAGQHGEEERDVVHGPGHRSHVRERAPSGRRPGRDAAGGRLVADDAAPRRRDPDRAAAVGAHRERAQSGGQRGRRAAAAPAGAALEIPRVPRDARERAVRDELVAELRGGGLPEDHRPVLAQARDRRSVVEPRLIRAHRARALKRRHASGEEDVLHGHRDPVEEALRLAAGPAGLAGPRGLERALGIQAAIRVHRAVQRLDPGERGPGGLHR